MAKEEPSVELDPGFEAALEAALALDPSERIDRYARLAEELQESLNYLLRLIHYTKIRAI